MELLHWKNHEINGRLNLETPLGEQLFYVLQQVDNEFVPRLSSRKTAYDHFNFGKNEDHIEQQTKNEIATNHSLKSYFDSMLQQNFILAIQDGSLAAFLSYRVARFNELKWPVSYVSTIATSYAYRGNSLAHNMYQLLQAYSRVEKRQIATRTWSTNYTHLHLLNKMGFKLFKKEEHDRGTGIHTIHYVSMFEDIPLAIDHKDVIDEFFGPRY